MGEEDRVPTCTGRCPVLSERGGILFHCVGASARQSRAQCCARELCCKILSFQNPARAGGDPVLLPHPSFGLSVFFLSFLPRGRAATKGESKERQAAAPSQDEEEESDATEEEATRERTTHTLPMASCGKQAVFFIFYCGGESGRVSLERGQFRA